MSAVQRVLTRLQFHFAFAPLSPKSHWFTLLLPTFLMALLAFAMPADKLRTCAKGAVVLFCRSACSGIFEI
jgi:hypothetical protein